MNTLPSDIGNPTANHIHNRLAVKERQLTGLTLIKGGDHPDVLRLFNECEQLRQQLEDINA